MDSNYKKITLALTLVSLGCFQVSSAFAKEYNKSTLISHEQRAKIDKVIAKSRALSTGSGEGEDSGAILSKGVTRTDCGRIDIGNVEAPKYGKKLPEIDRDIIITGDVINIATDCKNVEESAEKEKAEE